MKQKLFLVAIIAFVVSCMSCNNNSGMASSSAADSIMAASTAKDSILNRNKTTGLNAAKLFGLSTLDEAFKDIAPDAVDYGDGTNKPIKGLDSMKAGAKEFLSAFPDWKGENFTVLGDGNMVAVFGEYSGTFKAPLMGMKPTGKSFKIRDVDLFTFNDAGKITEHRNVQSFAAILSQVGAMMKK